MRVLVLAMVAGGACLAAGAAAAQTDCGKDLGPAVAAAWQALDGAKGRLGCPVTHEAATAPSTTGAVGLETDFTGGAILRWPEGSAHAGEAYAVSGCLYRLWFQYGGPTGWLGLPTAAARNTPDGQRQSFEGGEGWVTRSLDSCTADRAVQ